MLTIEEISDKEIKMIGKFDASQEVKATKALEKYQEELAIDMGELTYISSLGLGVLVKTNHILNQNGQTLVLKNLNSHIRDIFKFTRLEEVFKIEE